MPQSPTAPPYRYGDTIPLFHAKWIASHEITAMVKRLDGERGVTLIAADKSYLTLHSSWGLIISDTGSAVQLEEKIHANVLEILAAEKRHDQA